MKILILGVVAAMLGLFPNESTAQQAEAAAERARIANERIAAEAARRRSSSEAEVSGEAAAPDPGDKAADGGNVSATASAGTPRGPLPAASDRTPGRPAPSTATNADQSMTEILDQLQKLGELKDAGYVSDEEFQRLKRQILGDGL